MGQQYNNGCHLHDILHFYASNLNIMYHPIILFLFTDEHLKRRGFLHVLSDLATEFPNAFDSVK